MNTLIKFKGEDPDTISKMNQLYNENKELVLINTTGGITCNDTVRSNIIIENSQASISSQAAEKIYAGIGDPAEVNIDITLKKSDLNDFW